MFDEIKPLIVVLALAALVFYLAKPIALQFMTAEDLSRRRLVWFLLTGVSFMSSNFWLYTLVAVPMLLWLSRRDSNPIALYAFMLHVVPPVPVIIPILGKNGLFELDNFRLLAFCVLLPATIRHRKTGNTNSGAKFGAMDVLVLAFGALQIALYTCPDLPNHFYIPDSPTNVLRRAVLFFVDVYLLYYAVSRICRSRAMLLDVAASFCLASGVLAAVAMFEHAKGWLLYIDLATRWGTDPNAAFYLTRGGGVRAQASAGHSIALGHVLAVAFGLWLYLKSHVQDTKRRIGGTLLFIGGVIAAFSRGGWLGAAIIYLTFSAVGPRGLSRLAKGTAIAAAMGCLVLVSPLGDTVLQLLPKSGQPADLYRHRLAERGWELVFAHPFFGDQFPWPEMEDLRQGEGIIDIVNTYLGVGLNYGLVGLFCFLGFILIGTTRVFLHSKALVRSDPDLAMFGASLFACIVGTLVMIDSDSFIRGPAKLFYVLAGLAAAYAAIAKAPHQHQPAVQSANTMLQGRH